MIELKNISKKLLRNSSIIINSFNGINSEHRKMISFFNKNIKNESSIAIVVEEKKNLLSTKNQILEFLDSYGIEKYFNLNNTACELESILDASYIVTSKEFYSYIDKKFELIIPEFNPELTDKKIMSHLKKGELIKANILLDRKYSVTGTVIHGKQLGRTVGMPTANLEINPNFVLPANGVYASLSKIDGKTYIGVTNIGNRPTVDNNTTITFETHYIDFEGDLYGREMEVFLYLPIRKIKKFNTLMDVKKQVNKDIIITKKYMRKFIS